jgi:hypothetical protein
VKVCLDIRNACNERSDSQTIGNKSECYRKFGPLQLDFFEKVWVVVGWQYAT